MFEYAVIGSGVGGTSIASLLNKKGFKVALFEKDANLGGCSSTFTHQGYSYNSGATTLAGYQEGQIVKEVFDEIGFSPDLYKTDPSIVIMQNGKTTPRYQDVEKFIKVLNTNYPHAKNEKFWRLVHKINVEFYAQSGHYYSGKNIFLKLKSLCSFFPMFFKFSKYLRSTAYSFLEKYFDGIDAEYLDFLEAQILIVAQAKTKEINFFTAALALGYTFNDNYYAYGGMGALFDGMSKDIESVYKKTEITKIKKEKDCFRLESTKGEFFTKKIILNSTVYDSAKLFEDTKIQNYYKKYEKLDNHQSSFMLFMSIKTTKEFEHHYQVIQETEFPHAKSKALFISVSHKDDELLAKKGEYSISVSIHTDNRFWQDERSYKAQKKELQDILTKRVLDSLGIDESEIVHIFSATPKTFKRYINRAQLGGNAITMKNFLPFLPSNDTPIENVYNVGDSVFAAQGWPGVMLGVTNLTRLLHV